MARIDEKLTEIIREFPVLYNKNESGYKDKNGIVKKAWEKVVSQIFIQCIVLAMQLASPEYSYGPKSFDLFLLE